MEAKTSKSVTRKQESGEKSKKDWKNQRRALGRKLTCTPSEKEAISLSFGALSKKEYAPKYFPTDPKVSFNIKFWESIPTEKRPTEKAL